MLLLEHFYHVVYESDSSSQFKPEGRVGKKNGGPNNHPLGKPINLGASCADRLVLRQGEAITEDGFLASTFVKLIKKVFKGLENYRSGG